MNATTNAAVLRESRQHAGYVTVRHRQEHAVIHADKHTNIPAELENRQTFAVTTHYSAYYFSLNSKGHCNRTDCSVIGQD